MRTPLDYARERMHTLPVAISGQHGHNTTFRVACEMVRNFRLDEDDTLELMREYNQKLAEKWTENELRHKVQDAMKLATQPRAAAGRRYVRKSWSNPPLTLVKQPRLNWKIVPRALPDPPHSPPAQLGSPEVELVPDTWTAHEPRSKFTDRADAADSRPATVGAGVGSDKLRRDVLLEENDFIDANVEVVSSLPAVYPTIVTDATRLADAVRLLESVQTSVALDIETYGKGKHDALDPRRGDIRLLTLAVPGHDPMIVDLKAIGYDLGPLATTLSNREVIIHNAGFDALWLRRKCGVRLPKVFCTMSAARLLHLGDETQKNDLQTCLQKFCGTFLPKEQARSDWSQPELSPEQLAYAVNDVAYLHDLKANLQTRLASENLIKTFQLEMALLPCVIDIETRGFAVDGARLRQILEETGVRADNARQRVQCDLNIKNANSPDQLLAGLKAKGIDITNTSKETLAEFEYPQTALILEYRAVEGQRKQAKTILDHTETNNRIYARFNPLGTKSGRFTSTDPNLQNVGRGELRSVFVAGSGNALVVADYSQIELRIAAVVANETAMIEAFHSNQDLHRLTAARILAKDPAEVTKAERQLAKAVNFGLLFGQSARGLRRYAKDSYGVEISEEEAQRFRGIFFATYPGLRQWHEQARRAARGDDVREARTVSGRRRLLASGSENEWSRFTTLVNMPVQGAAADGMKRAMVALAHALPKDAGIVSTVHDEIIVETPRPLAEEVKGLVTRVMIAEMAALFSQVPIEVEAAVCTNWAGK